MQPSTLKWGHAPTDKDGNPYTAANNAGYMVSFDGGVPKSIDLKYGDSFDISNIVAGLESGTHTASIAMVSTEGVVGDYSAPVSFTVHPHPSAPVNVSVT